MFDFLKKKKEEVNPYPNYSKADLELTFPMNHLTKVESIGIINYNGNEIAYKHIDFALFDNIDPKEVVVLTNKTGEKFPAPAKLKKTNEATAFPTYTFVSDGKTFAFRDKISERKKNVFSYKVKELIEKSIVINHQNQNLAIEEYIARQQAEHDHDIIDSMFSR